MDEKDLEHIKKKIDNAKDDKEKEIIEAAQKRQIEHEERIKLMKPAIDAIRKLKNEIESINEDTLRVGITDTTITVTYKPGFIADDRFAITTNKGINQYKLTQKNTYYGNPEFYDGPVQSSEKVDFYKTPTEVIEALVEKLI